MPATQLLKNRDKKFRLLFEEHPQPMWIFDPEGERVIHANAASEALLGYGPGELDNKEIVDILGAEETRRFQEELRKPARAASVAHRMCSKSGRLLDVEMAVHDVDLGGGKLELAVLLDATARRQLEEQLRQAQKMEAVGMLAGGIAHDFNNLLTIITGYSQLILNSLPQDDPNHNSAEQIMKAGERAGALTRQLLAFSRRQVLQPKVVDVNRLVTGLSAMLQRLIGEDVDLRLVLSPDLGRVSADPGQLEQVLMNLVVNARDAMPRGGSLTIETRNSDLDESYTGRHVGVKPGPYVMVAVSDTGTGMDEATRERLFEPFFTTKASGQGTGLGLSTVFGIVKQSGGSLDVYSAPGAGTSVKVYLPRIDQAAPVEPEVTRRVARRAVETILVVEDEEAVRSLVRETLQREGYRVLDSADPLEARRMSENTRQHIDLLVTDVVMPRISGRVLAQELLASRPGMKVLYMSGYTDNAVINSGILPKEVAFLQKPFTPTALIEKIREVLEGGGNGRSKHAGG